MICNANWPRQLYTYLYICIWGCVWDVISDLICIFYRCFKLILNIFGSNSDIYKRQTVTVFLFFHGILHVCDMPQKSMVKNFDQSTTLKHECISFCNLFFKYQHISWDGFHSGLEMDSCCWVIITATQRIPHFYKIQHVLFCYIHEILPADFIKS